MELNVITPRGAVETIVRVVDGKPVVVPPPAPEQTAPAPAAR